jgi:hypothetical protein
MDDEDRANLRLTVAILQARRERLRQDVMELEEELLRRQNPRGQQELDQLRQHLERLDAVIETMEFYANQ